MNMEELVSLIEELKKAEGKGNEELHTDWEIQARNSNQENKQYENSREGELLQELDETKDTGKRMELIAEIRKERESNLNNLNDRLNDEIGRLEGILNDIRNRDIRAEVLNSNDLDPNRIIDTRNPEEKKEYENSREGELLQELDETRDVYRRREIIAEILNERESQLIKQRDAEISNIEELLSSLKNREFDKILEQFNNRKSNEQPVQSTDENIENQSSIEQGEKTNASLYKNVSDEKSKDTEETMEFDDEYNFYAHEQNGMENNEEEQESEQQEIPAANSDIKWHRELTPEQIEELIAEGIYPGDAEYYLSLRNYGIRDDDKNEGAKGLNQTEESVEEQNNPTELEDRGTRVSLEEPESRESADYIPPPPPPPPPHTIEKDGWTHENDESRGSDDDTPPPPPGGGAAGVSIPVEANEESKPKEPDDNTPPTPPSGGAAGMAPLNNVILKLINVFYDKILVKTDNGEYTIDQENMYNEAKNDMNNLSEATQRRLEQKYAEGLVDNRIFTALLKNEEQLNSYLDLCELYQHRNTKTPEYEAALEQFLATENLPMIEYDCKELRKSKIDAEEKVNYYNQAIAAKLMFKNMGLKDKFTIKKGFIDRLYLETLRIGLKTKELLGIGRENNEKIAEQTEKTSPIEGREIEEDFLDKHSDLFTEIDEGTVLTEEEEKKLFEGNTENSQREEELSPEELNQIFRQTYRSRIHPIDHEKAMKDAAKKQNETPIQEENEKV